eukprot:4365288-Pleurochrysis_carterae.AAC.1
MYVPCTSPVARRWAWAAALRSRSYPVPRPTLAAAAATAARARTAEQAAKVSEARRTEQSIRRDHITWDGRHTISLLL